ncbi:Ribose 5-phosphate isomerase B [Bacillus badius]|uniref:Ribose 5-phosphate isomerase B n=1 Tax=Bacillus badius TaxID=1455 RepID=A0ABR5AYS2_BACBA|nr:Ribose 5-phosphate isomerase B [Bacillus badius]
MRPRRRFGGEKAHCPPRGKRSAWNGNQQPPSASKRKTSFVRLP